MADFAKCPEIAVFHVSNKLFREHWSLFLSSYLEAFLAETQGIGRFRFTDHTHPNMPGTLRQYAPAQTVRKTK